MPKKSKVPKVKQLGFTDNLTIEEKMEFLLKQQGNLLKRVTSLEKRDQERSIQIKDLEKRNGELEERINEQDRKIEEVDDSSYVYSLGNRLDRIEDSSCSCESDYDNLERRVDSLECERKPANKTDEQPDERSFFDFEIEMDDPFK